jgi:hypothetical protein
MLSIVSMHCPICLMEERRISTSLLNCADNDRRETAKHMFLIEIQLLRGANPPTIGAKYFSVSRP